MANRSHTPNNITSNNNTTTTTSSSVGPRAKCDQVVYEAIAKAAEIVVRSRCDLSKNSQEQQEHQQQSRQPQFGNVGLTPGGTTTTTGGTSSRFNLEVEEVEEVRAILQRWKRSLHVPLRLDIFYEYEDTEPEETKTSGGGGTESRPLKRDLLERWCIDYVASSAHDVSKSNHSVDGYSNEDTLVRLRRVCKRVVIVLRSLYCLARMMPAYRLHCGLVDSSNGSRGGGVGYGNGFGVGMGTGPHDNGGYYFSSKNTKPTMSSAQDSPAVGRIGFSFYVSGHEDGSSGGAGTSLCSKTGAPFTKQELSSIPTPYGMLHFTSFYDQSLNVDSVLSGRNIVPERLGSEGIQQQQQHLSQTHAIQVPMSNGSNQNQKRDDEDNGIHPRHNSLPYKKDGGAVMHTLSPPAGRRVSDHIIQNYADRPLSSLATHNGVVQQEQNEIDDEQDGTESKRVLSGLSLALMNEELSNNGTDNNTQTDKEESNSEKLEVPTPLVRTQSDENPALRRQRMALHHPPPFPTTTTPPPPNTSNTNPNSPHIPGFLIPPKNLMNQRDSSNGSHHSANEYGYGYNNPRTSFQRQRSSSPGAGMETSPAGSTTNTPPNTFYLGTTPPFCPSPHRPNPMVGTVGIVSQPPAMRISPGDPSCQSRANALDDKYKGLGCDDKVGASTNGGGAISTSADKLSPPFESNPLTLRDPPPTTEVCNTHVSSMLHPNKDNNNQTLFSHHADTTDNNQHLPALDQLQMNPFKSNNNADLPTDSIFSSITMNGNGSSPDEVPFGGTAFAGGSDFLLRGSSLESHQILGGGEFHHHGPSSFEDMPFAVDLPNVNPRPDNEVHMPANLEGQSTLASNPFTEYQGGSNNIGSSVGPGSSQLTASLAHRCATAGPLKFFSEQNGESSVDGGTQQEHQGSQKDPNDELSSLTEQLAEFRSFGASISTVAGAGEGMISN